jgi:hypothetical protein
LNEADQKFFELYQKARKLSVLEVEALESSLVSNPLDLNARVQVLFYYSAFEKNSLKFPNAEQKLFEQALWFIENMPAVDGFLRHHMSRLGICFKPKRFAALRQVWLDLISSSPPDGAIFGNAASFIVWNDLETASDLFEKAYALQPDVGWLGSLVIFCNSDLWQSPLLYKNALRERVIDVGVRSLQTERGGAQFLTCQYVCDAALELGRFEIVRWCAEIMNDYGPEFRQEGRAYIGLVALRENTPDQAIQLTQKMNQPLPAVFRLARELFDFGERELISGFVRRLGKRIKNCARQRWLMQIENDEAPDFQDWCTCKTCR